MSSLANIDITLVEKGGEEILAKDLINVFINNGWTWKINGKALFIPVGDNTNCNWVHEEMNYDDLIRIIEKKESLQEPNFITLAWGKTEKTIIMGIYSERELFIIINGKKKMIYSPVSNESLIDISWYLRKTILLLNDNGFYVESYRFGEKKSIEEEGEKIKMLFINEWMKKV